MKTRLLTIGWILVFFVCPLSAWTQNTIDPKILKVGIYDNPPKIFLNSEGNPDGIFLDILKSISKKEDFQIEYITGSWSELYTKLINGEIDILPDMAYSNSRDTLFNFSMPVLSSWLQVFATKKSMINNVADLHNKRIGVLEASSQEKFMQVDTRKKYNIDYSVFTYESYYNSVVALKEDKVDVIVANRFFYFSDLCDQDIIPTGVILELSELHFAFSKTTSPDFIKLFDKHISLLKNNPQSDFYNSLQKWFNKNKTVIPDYLKFLIVILILGLMVFLLFILLLKHKVKVRTKILNNKNEELIIAKEKAEESDKLKTVFLQNMSHEIRTPMNGILGFLSLLKKPHLNDEKKNQYIDIINESGERLLNTINDIIEVSKIESNQVVVRQSKVDIAEIMDFHLNFFIEKAKQKELFLHISQQLPKEKSLVETDKNLLGAILTNLLNNSIKFTNKGSIEFGNYLDANNLVFFVKDTGIGIPAHRQEAIFERFVYADLQLSRSHEGSGLGLSIVKSYVGMLNGKIWVESEIDKGSTFFFSIPYKPKYPIASNISEENNSQTQLNKQFTILIAEDDDISYKYLEIIIKPLNVNLLRAKNGKESVQFLKENPNISLILMDIKMPIMNGLEATSEIRKFNSTIPIIAQTAYAMNEDKENIIQVGCNDVITKPIDNNELIKLIKNMLEET